MKSIKKFIAVILVFAMSSGIMCFAADDNEYNGFKYSGSAITGYSGSTSGLIIPDTINNVAITSIKADAFQNKSFITSVIISASITKIGDGAFAGCSNLREVKFEGETAVIGKSVFSGCGQLSNITLPSGLTAIKNSTFYGCSSLTDIDIPDSVTKIEDSAFENSGLTQVSISSDISGIGALAFAGCKDLKAFYVDANNSAYCTDSCNALFSKDMTELIQFPACSSVTEYTIPEGTTTIDELAFAKNKTIETVTFSSTVNEISPYAFSECTALANVYLNEGLRTIGALAFSGCTSLKSITIPSTVTDFGSAFYNSGLTSVIIENGVTSISSGAFDTCSSLESVSIPKSLTTIEAGAFKDCTSLKSLSIPSTVTEIKDKAFMNIEDGLTLYVREGSYALEYAKQNSLNYLNVSVIISIDNNPSSKAKKINYGETLTMQATCISSDENASVLWVTSDGTQYTDNSFSVSTKKNSITVTAKAVNENGEPFTDEDGNEITDTITVSVNSSIIKQIISFFKNLFKMNRNVTL